MKTVVMVLLFALSINAQANDVRQEAILTSRMIKLILGGLKKEQHLKCSLIKEEDGSLSITFYDESNLSKYRANYLCEDGRVATFTGVISDGGLTTVESFKLELGPS